MIKEVGSRKNAGNQTIKTEPNSAELMIRVFVVLLFLVYSLIGAAQIDNQLIPTTTSDSVGITVSGYFDPIEPLQGKLPGLSVMKKGGHPDAAHSVLIRGLSTVYFDPQPEYFYDHMRVIDPSLLDPFELNHVSVYKNLGDQNMVNNLGTQGMIVFHQNAQEIPEGLQVEYNGLIAMDMASGMLDLLDYDEYLQYIEDIDFAQNFLDGGAKYDYREEFIRPVISHLNRVSVSGGRKGNAFKASAYHKKQGGIIENSGAKQQGASLQLMKSLLDNKLDIQLLGRIDEREYEGVELGDPNDIFYQMYRYNPTDPFYNDDGSYADPDRIFNQVNPKALLDNIEHKRGRKQMMLGFATDYHLGNNFELYANVGYTKAIFNRRTDVHPTEAYYEGYYEEEDKETEMSRINSGLGIRHKLSLAEKHNFLTSLSYNYIQNKDEYDYENPMSRFMPVRFMYSVDSGYYESRIGADLYDLSLKYAYDGKYILGGSIIYEDRILLMEDRSDVYLQNNKFKSDGFYSRAMAKWVISEESFMQKQKLFSNLSLNAVYGTGANIGHSYLLDFNKDWDVEKMKEYSVTLDAAMFDNTVQARVSYFNRTASDVYHPVPVFCGYVEDNSLSIDNSGIEFSLLLHLVDNDKFKYYTHLAFYKLDNRVSSFYDDLMFAYTEAGYIEQFPIQFVQSDQALYGFYLPHFVEVKDEQMYLEAVDGSLTPYFVMAQQYHSGQVLPAGEVYWNNHLCFSERLSLDLGLRYVYGHSIYNEPRMYLNGSFGVSTNALQDETEVIHYSLVSDYYLEKADYLRLDYLSFSYDLPLFSDEAAEGLELYLGARNLITFSGFTGIDPEPDYTSGSMGLDGASVYPAARSFFFGVNLRI